MEDKMNRLKKYLLSGLVPLIVVFWTGFCFGEETVVNINSAIAISSPDQDALHILVKPALGLPDTTLRIERAILSATISPQTQDTTTFISIRMHPITTDWDPGNVNWNTPWTEPGGDIDEIHYGEFLTTEVGNQPVEMDITSLLMRWTNGRLPYYGLLVKISRSSIDRFTLVRNGNDPYATINIHYSVY
jgi:hypothetical protein